METLTERQQAILDFIRQRSEQGLPVPSVREITSEMGLASPSTAHMHLAALKRKGYLSRDGRSARSVRLVHDTVKRVPAIPILGSIPAGHGDLRTQESDGMVYVDLDSLRLPVGSRAFALRVTGDSMIGKHIMEGDVVILEQGAEARAGEVVAALIDGQSTLKTFVREKGRSWLKAENPHYPDLIPAAELMIQGVMRMVIRETRPKGK